MSHVRHKKNKTQNKTKKQKLHSFIHPIEITYSHHLKTCQFTSSLEQHKFIIIELFSRITQYLTPSQQHKIKQLPETPAITQDFDYLHNDLCSDYVNARWDKLRDREIEKRRKRMIKYGKEIAHKIRITPMCLW